MKKQNLIDFIKSQKTPFTTFEAAIAIGFKAEDLTDAHITHIGIRISQIGCKRIEYRFPYTNQVVKAWEPAHESDPVAIHSGRTQARSLLQRLKKVIKQALGFFTPRCSKAAEIPKPAPALAAKCRRPYSTDFYSCTCSAADKDDCRCCSTTSRSYTKSASSGVARSSNTD